MMASPITKRVCLSIAEALNRDSRTGAALLAWPGEPIRDAMPLRLVGGLHALALTGDAELGELFAGAGDDPVGIVRRALVRHDEYLLPWLDGPPQTNEAARSAALMVALLEIARRHGAKLELLEIGSSAGLNLLIDRYRFDLGGVAIGPPDAPVKIAPEWRGPPPSDAPVEIVSVRGVDVAPVDLSDPAAGRAAARLCMGGRAGAAGADDACDRDAAADGRAAATPPTGSRRGWPSRRRMASRAC